MALLRYLRPVSKSDSKTPGKFDSLEERSVTDGAVQKIEKKGTKERKLPESIARTESQSCAIRE